MYHIVDNIERILNSRHDDFDVSIIQSGRCGNCIKDLIDRYKDDVESESPDALIIYWDSDAADVNENGRAAKIRKTYKENLEILLSTASSQIKYIALGGPTLYGEKPHGSNARDNILDAYTEINRNVSYDFGIKYLETRQLFFRNLPSDWHKGGGYLTIDGEHHNMKGSVLIQDLFIETLDEMKGLWME
jgi:hypothetical protein